MASMAEILTRESLLECRIYLYREGIFWKAYQYSAYRVLQRQGGFRLKKKFVKTVSSEVISLGFPDITLERLFHKHELEYVNEKVIGISCDDLDIQAYEQWFDTVSLTEPSKSERNQPEDTPFNKPVAVLRRIKEFRIEESTPMECMNFLAPVRKDLIGYGDI